MTERTLFWLVLHQLQGLVQDQHVRLVPRNLGRHWNPGNSNTPSPSPSLIHIYIYIIINHNSYNVFICVGSLQCVYIYILCKCRCVHITYKHHINICMSICIHACNAYRILPLCCSMLQLLFLSMGRSEIIYSFCWKMSDLP